MKAQIRAWQVSSSPGERSWAKQLNYLGAVSLVPLSAAALAASPARSMADAKMQKRGSEMTTLTPYLLFDGKCQQAMEFYNSCFGGDLAATKVKDSPAKDFMAAFQQDKIVNARLRNGELEISASDWLRPAQTPIRGNTVCLYLSGGTLEELKPLFERLSDAAEVTDPLKEQFFGTTEH
jgi:PhnB protein